VGTLTLHKGTTVYKSSSSGKRKIVNLSKKLALLRQIKHNVGSREV